MSKQEQLIAQKRQQILEKQRTLQMAKQIAAEASKNTPCENDEESEKSSGLKIPFSNDGSFLENFKKLSEKLAKTTEEHNKRPAEDDASNIEKKAKTEETIPISIPPPPPPPAPPTPSVSVAVPNALPMEISYATYYAMAAQASTMMPLIPTAPLPPPIPMPIPEVSLVETIHTVPVVPVPSSIDTTPVDPAGLEVVPEVGANCKGSYLTNSQRLTETIDT